MTKDEEVLAAVMQERGYLVVRSWRNMKPGDIIPRLGRMEQGRPVQLESEQRFFVIQSTTVEDYEAQRSIMEERFRARLLPPGEGDMFYRVGTD